MSTRSSAGVDRQTTFDRQGWVVVPSLLSNEELGRLRELFGQGSPATGRGGVRSMMTRFPAARDVANDRRLLDLAAQVLGSPARPVKCTLFDKNPEANWALPFHQDTVIAVRERAELEGFGPWSLKDEVPHAGAPASVLSRMVALRLHLDDTPTANGALRVVPGSHRHGRLEPSEVRRLRTESGEISCPVGVGGVLAMSPLLLHASSAAEFPSHRRVLHIEYAAGELPAPLEWAE